MKILVVGSGGREHALAWKLAKSERCRQVFCAPGNAGTHSLGTNIPIEATDTEGLIRFVKQEGIDLTVVGPEGPLAQGIVNRFQEEGLKIFGPSKAAARLESSKSFAREFCRRYNIPSPRCGVFDSVEEAKEYLEAQSFPVVLKADGLAHGKGVLICPSKEEALKGLETLLVKKPFGEACEKILIEEFLAGEEVSFIGIADGRHLLAFSSTRDHKRLLDGDQGPNTGGMGAYSPAPHVTGSLTERILQGIMRPAIRGMADEGMPYVGFLYAGLMLTREGPKVLEFNARLGDPETQVLLPRLRTDLVELMELALEGNLEGVPLSWESMPAACVVMASRGYPEAYGQGFPVQGLEDAAALPRTHLFHAGTALQDGQIVTAGGRVLGVTALAEDLRGALRKAYEACGKISWQGVYYRKDIGGKFHA